MAKRTREWYEPGTFGKVCSAVVASVCFPAFGFELFRLLGTVVFRTLTAGILAGLLSAAVYGACTEFFVEKQFQDFLDGKED